VPSERKDLWPRVAVRQDTAVHRGRFPFSSCRRGGRTKQIILWGFVGAIRKQTCACFFSGGRPHVARQSGPLCCFALFERDNMSSTNDRIDLNGDEPTKMVPKSNNRLFHNV
jgi:hypothetical protein